MQQRVSRRDLLVKGGAFGAAALLAGCGSSSSKKSGTASASSTSSGSSGTPRRGGTLTWGLEQDPGEIAPFGGLLTESWIATQPVYESLLQWDRNLNVRPALATAYHYRNSRTIDFDLRKGVAFHNGKEMTADDCVYSFELQLHPPAPGSVSVLGQVPAIAGTEAIGSHTVRMHLHEPDARVLGYLAWQRYSAIVPRDMYKQLNPATHGIGTGPMKLNGAYVPNDHVNLERNPHYWNRSLPYLDALNYKIIPDEQSRIAALRTGGIQGATLSVQSVKALKGDSSLQVLKGLTTAFREIQFTIKKGERKPWSDVRVRQAVNYALDRRTLINSVYGGDGQLSGFLPPGYGDWPLSESDLAGTYEKFNLAKAKQLMAAAGYSKGFSVTMSTFSTPADMPQLAALIKYQLQSINIDVKIAAQDPTTFATNNGNGTFDWDLTMRGMRGDPDGYVAEYSPAGESVFNTWFSGYSNARMADLVQRGRTTQNVGKRRQIYASLQQLLETQLIEIPLIAVDSYQVVTSKLMGMYVSITGGNEGLYRDAWMSA